MDHKAAREFILRRLKEGLPVDRTYHSLEHTLDVYASAISIGEKEKLNDSEMELLKIAALYHDAGFVIENQNHEINGCKMARNDLPQFGYLDQQIDHICEMIMSTKVPQTPKDKLGRILCDADLDYLGRQDFEQIGNCLFQEFLMDGVVADRIEWDELQVKFISQHEFYTETNRLERSAKKAENLKEVIARVESRK